ncbi:MAG TPA: hypothetical protein VGE11_27755 [Pseudonocardia sp.]
MRIVDAYNGEFFVVDPARGRRLTGLQDRVEAAGGTRRRAVDGY